MRETKTSALHEIANRYSDAGFSDQALKIANTINHEGWKNLALSTVVWSYIESKNYDQALRVTKTIQGSELEGAMRELALYQVAEAYTAVQQYDKALSLLKVAENAKQKDAVSAGMANGYAKSGQVHEAIKLFNDMEKDGVEPDVVTLASVLPACGDLSAFDLGKQIHELIRKKRMCPNIALCSFTAKKIAPN